MCSSEQLHNFVKYYLSLANSKEIRIAGNKFSPILLVCPVISLLSQGKFGVVVVIINLGHFFLINMLNKKYTRCESLQKFCLLFY